MASVSRAKVPFRSKPNVYATSGTKMLSYRIEASTDVVNWTTIGAGGAITRCYSIEEQPQRFFRSRRN